MSYYNFGQYLYHDQKIQGMKLVVTRTNGIDVDTNTSLALTSLGGGGLVDDTADELTLVMPFFQWLGTTLGQHQNRFTAFLQAQININTVSTYWRAENVGPDSLSLIYTGDSTNWGSTSDGTAVGSSGTEHSVDPSQKQIVLIFVSTIEGAAAAYKLYTQGEDIIIQTADGNNTDKTGVFTLDSFAGAVTSGIDIPLTSEGVTPKAHIREIYTSNMPGSSASNLDGYTFNINTNLYEAGTSDTVKDTVLSRFTTGQDFTDPEGYDYSDAGGFDSSSAGSLDTNQELATQIRAMLAGNPALSNLTFGSVTDSGEDDAINNGVPDIYYFTVTGPSDGTRFDMASNTSSHRKVYKFTNNAISNASQMQTIFKDLDFNQPGLNKNIYKVYIRWRVQDSDGSMSKSYIKAFYGIDGENLDQIGYGRTFDAAKSLNYDSDGLVWHEDISDIKTTTISDALTTATGTNGQGIVSGSGITCSGNADSTGVLINNGSGYPAGTTSAMTVSEVDARTHFTAGYDVVNANGIKIGRATTVVETAITCSAGTLVDVIDDEPLYNSMTLVCGSANNSDIATTQGVSGANGIPVDSYVVSVNEAGAVDFFNINNVMTTDVSASLSFKSNFVTVASIDDINRGDAGMIVTTTSTIDAAGAHTSTERMLLNPINQTDKVLKLFRPYQSGVAAHASGSTLHIFPKTKSYVSELTPTDNIRNISSFQLKLESGSGVPSQFEVEDITIVYRIKGVR